ncbi:putative hydro-lyase [Virgibacillus ndiopensis]|uniref:putative hydro-lyase n=1 Tax=Virgibacillus ndiopensis TaxID=2004408 RepID=UPI000C084BF9|nr:putative hydro-lyase [Virgibacillus ndiopensis]
MTPKEQRLRYRMNLDATTTSGLCDDYLQVNLITLPREYAFEFLLFCRRNPKACPLVDILEGGSTQPLVADADIRTDLPKYRIYKNGIFENEVLDVTREWKEEFVTFLIGCSFTFEKALNQAGIRLLHQEQTKVVPMFKTNIPCEKSGRFEGNMVVSMRALKEDEIEKAVEITSKFETSHGGPVHVGNPGDIGVQDIYKPDYGECVKFDENDRIPVFWACGVTPQNVCIHAKPEIMITHAPGHMLITDRVES